MEQTVIHRGSCHCGAVSFEVDAPACIKVEECNCSICRKSAYLHLIVSRDRMRIVRGEDNLAAYTFNTGTAKHLFCKTCGVKSFYVPRSHPAGYSVNARCIDSDTIKALDIEPFDGRNWEANVASLRPLDGD
jgi:hypothetical protein